ncbi:peptidoglycan DD-metalloendopeptidase family protein [Oceanomicrobium pacificus]|uniref:Peptidoglycan DD-metalloendopeptidase family protein n=1 Tax=Oceanomicrobium pacificus TaxID=2692916 RepID=A0A6B0TM48_9RHOB|nr:peptidoglycan DD-metalloendopeptidase family protein [Oceanomicrobium pacificus]MXU65627.1 peptidoglycan DD-metalloendopeptidase family protein [Oceanomicrobium pacificus]
MTFTEIVTSRVGLIATAALLTLSACTDEGITLGGRQYGGTSAPASAERPPADSRGVITYPTYQVMVARSGDTVSSMAQRVGLSPTELARHNGLPETYSPLAGELLVLPRNVGGTVAGTSTAWSPEIATAAIDSASAAPGTNPFNNGSGPEGAIEPIRHRVEPGETAYSIARLYNVSVTALASWNGLGPDLAVRPGRELLIPVPESGTRTTAAAAPATVTQPGSGGGTPLPPPPSATAPLPADVPVPESAKPKPEPKPTPAPTQQAASSSKFAKPVSGNVVEGYTAKSEGVEFGAKAGEPVKAAEAGEVALISPSLSGLGTIVLIRHKDNILTVYGRVDNVSVSKGTKVARGQQIATVAASDKPRLHFEVRRGTEAVDPAPYFR